MIRIARVLALALLGSLPAAPLAASAPQGAGDPSLDEVVLKDGKRLKGRVLSVYDPEELLLLVGTNTVEIAKEDVASVSTLRERLRTFLSERQAPMHPADEWKLVARAEALGLPAMARVQAYHVLTLDPEHEGAHRLVGHERKGRGWGWVQNRRPYSLPEFVERIADWDHRFVLESEHWIVETNTGVTKAVELAMDLERFYVFWMDRFGPELRPHEFVRDPDRKMTYWVLADANEQGIDWISTLRGEPYYSADESVTTEEGNPNVAITFTAGAAYPQRFFDVATQQLMYSMLVLGDVKGGLPADSASRHAHWVELGMGYWFGRQFGGVPGYGKPLAFIPDPNVKRDARLPGRGPLRMGQDEITNLIGLPFDRFYTDRETFVIHRAKACSLFQFLIEQNPTMPGSGERKLEGRDALMCYLREVYRTPTAHSSSKLDDCLGRRVEELQEPWTEWLAR